MLSAPMGRDGLFNAGRSSALAGDGTGLAQFSGYRPVQAARKTRASIAAGDG